MQPTYFKCNVAAFMYFVAVVGNVTTPCDILTLGGLRVFSRFFLNFLDFSVIFVVHGIVTFMYINITIKNWVN